MLKNMNSKKLIGMAATTLIVVSLVVVLLITGKDKEKGLDNPVDTTSEAIDLNQNTDSNETFILDTDIIINEGERVSLEDLTSQGIISETRYNMRQTLVRNSESYEATKHSFLKEMDSLVGQYGSLEALMEDEKGLEELNAIVESVEVTEGMLSTQEDIVAYNSLYIKSQQKVNDGTSGDTVKVQTILSNMEKNALSNTQHIEFVNETNLKAQKNNASTVLLRWQQGSEWIPEYGYNLYRITDGSVELVEEGIGSIATVIENSDNYAELYLAKKGISNENEVSTLGESYKNLIYSSLINENKATIIGFDSEDKLNTFLIDEFDQTQEIFHVLDGELAFLGYESVAGQAADVSSYSQEELGLQTVISGRVATVEFNYDNGIDIVEQHNRIEENLQLALAEEELKKIVESRSLIAAGCDVDIELAKSAGFAYEDKVKNIEAEYITYILEPVYDLNEAMTDEEISLYLESYDLGVDYRTDIDTLQKVVQENPEDQVLAYTTIVPMVTVEPLKAPIQIDGYGVNNAVTMRWDIANDGYTELITSGYNVYRKLNSETEFKQINTEPILIQYSLQKIAGEEVNVEASFYYMDETVKNKDHVEYKVESIDLFGRVSGMSDNTLIIEEVIKTLAPNIPIIEKPIVVKNIENVETLNQLHYNISFDEKNQEQRIIVPISNEFSDVVMVNVYRSEAYGKDIFSDPVLVASLNGVDKKSREVIVREDNSTEKAVERDLQKVTLPGMFYQDKEVKRGYYYKYWVTGVDEWGNESSWSAGMIAGFPKETYESIVSDVESKVVEEVRLDEAAVLAGFINNRYNSVQLMEDIREKLFAFNDSMYATSKFVVTHDHLDLSGNDNAMESSVSAESYYGESLTYTSMMVKASLPLIISSELMNLPDVNQVHTMIGYTEEDKLVDGSIRVVWPEYANEGIGGYGVYRGTISGYDLTHINSMTTGEVLELLENCELVAETMENQLSDTPITIADDELLIYVVSLMPKAGERVAAYNHLETIKDSHAVGGWVRLEWEKPQDEFQVEGYRIYRSYVEGFRLMDIEDIDESSIDFKSLDWELVEECTEYSYYFESVDQMREQHVAYKISPVSLWKVEGEPIYEYVRIPALISPAIPSLLQPYSKPGTIEIRFNTVADAKSYTVYRTEVEKLNFSDVSRFLTDNQRNEIFGTNRTEEMFDDHTDIRQTFYKVSHEIELGDPIMITEVSESAVNASQVVDVDNFIDAVSTMSDETITYMNNQIINEFGVLATSKYMNLSQSEAETVEWEKIAVLSAEDLKVNEYGDVIPIGGTAIFVDQDVEFKNTYYYTVTSSNVDVESFKGEPVEAECKKYIPLTAPAHIESTSGLVITTDGEEKWANTVIWDHASEPGFRQKDVIDELLVGYIVYRKGSRSGNYYQVSNVIKENQFVDTSAYPYQTYYYRVQAIDIAGLLSDFTEEVITPNALLDSFTMAKTGTFKVDDDKLALLKPMYTAVVVQEDGEVNNYGLEKEIKEQLKNIPTKEIETYALKVLLDETLSDELKDVFFDILKDEYGFDMNTLMEGQEVSISQVDINTNTTDSTKPDSTKPDSETSESTSPDFTNEIDPDNITGVSEGIIYGETNSMIIDFNTVDFTDIDLQNVKPLSQSTEFTMFLVNSEFERLHETQTTLLGEEPEWATYEVEGGWIQGNDSSNLPVYYQGQVHQTIDYYREALSNAYFDIETTGNLKVGEYLIEHIPLSSVYKDKETGTILKGTGYIYYGTKGIKLPVVFKVDYSKDENRNAMPDYINLAMFPYRVADCGLTLTSLDCVIDQEPNHPMIVSGYLSKPKDGYLLTDLHMLYFEDATIDINGWINIEDGVFPAFHFDDYLVYDYTSMVISLDYLIDYQTIPDDMIANRRYPISLLNGRVDTSFGYPTMDNKGLEFGFKVLGIIPDYGLFGDISIQGDTVTRLIVPKGISIRLSSGKLRLDGYGTDKAYTNLVGEVLLPYLSTPTDFVMPDYRSNNESDPLRNTIGAYGNDDPRNTVINIFNQVKEGGIVLLDGDAYDLSSIPFVIDQKDIDYGFILEHVKIDRTFVGNYNIFESRYLTGDYDEDIDAMTQFILSVQGSMTVESEDATVDLSVVEKGSTTKSNKWYSGVEWKGILLDQGTIAISAYKIQQKLENGSEEIKFTLREQELIYDRNGFIYQNFMESVEDMAIVFGSHYGNFQNAILQSGSAEIYNGEIRETYEGTVMIPAFLNKSVKFSMQTDAEKASSCVVLPTTIVLNNPENETTAKITMEIHGGYFDKLGVHLEGAIRIPALSDEKMEFAELILPSNPLNMVTYREDLGEGEQLEYGTAMFTKPYVVDFNGYKMELAYFDMYSMTDLSRSVKDVLGNEEKISNIDIKLYGSAALTSNMELKSSEKNAQIYLHDIHGEGDFDLTRCQVQVKIPSGNGYITGTVTAQGDEQVTNPDLMNEIGDGLRSAAATSQEVLDIVGDAQAINRYLDNITTEIDTFQTTVNNKSFALSDAMEISIKEDVMTTLLENSLDSIVNKSIDLMPIRISAKNEVRDLIDTLNMSIEDYNQKVEELKLVSEMMYQLPDDFDTSQYTYIEPIDKGMFMEQIDFMINTLEEAIYEEVQPNLNAMQEVVSEASEAIVEEFSIAVPDINIEFEGFELNNQFATDSAASEELAKLAEESIEAVGEFKEYIDIASGGDDGIVRFDITGEEAFEMVLDESLNFLQGSNIQAVGTFGYKIAKPGTDEEDLNFYAIGIGYVDSPNGANSSLNLGVLELANLVCVTGYNMKLPYTKAEGYTVGFGSELLKCVKDLEVDEDNNKESFFIAAGDAYILSNRASHICALKNMRYISESDGSFEITGELMGPELIQAFATPSSNNSLKKYGSARILYNARENAYKLTSYIDGVPIDPAGVFVVGGTVGLEWDEHSFMIKLGYPKDMHLVIGDVLEGTFGMMAGINPYSKNLIFMMKMGVGIDKSFEAGIVYAGVGIHAESKIGYGAWNLFDEKKEFPWYEDGAVFEGVGADTRIYGYMKGGIDIGKKYDIISASIDASASIVNPREDISYVLKQDGDYDVKKSGNKDKNEWILHADLRIKYSIGFWLVSYSDDFYYDLQTTIN